MSEVKLEREYHPNGQLHLEIPWVNGQKHGIEKQWHKNGQL